MLNADILRLLSAILFSNYSTTGHVYTMQKSNAEVRAFCGMIAALALLPENDVRLGLQNLKEIADEMPLMTIPLLEYVERVYVGSEVSPARFPPFIWNVHLQPLRRDYGTNNMCQRRNNKFARHVGHSRPTTWNCIAALRLTKCFPDARSANLKFAKKNIASIQLFILQCMQGCSTFVYDIATVKYWGGIFYDPAPTAAEIVAKMVLPAFFNFN